MVCGHLVARLACSNKEVHALPENTAGIAVPCVLFDVARTVAWFRVDDIDFSLSLHAVRALVVESCKDAFDAWIKMVEEAKLDGPAFRMVQPFPHCASVLRFSEKQFDVETAVSNLMVAGEAMELYVGPKSFVELDKDLFGKKHGIFQIASALTDDCSGAGKMMGAKRAFARSVDVILACGLQGRSEDGASFGWPFGLSPIKYALLTLQLLEIGMCFAPDNDKKGYTDLMVPMMKKFLAMEASESSFKPLPIPAVAVAATALAIAQAPAPATKKADIGSKKQAQLLQPAPAPAPTAAGSGAAVAIVSDGNLDRTSAAAAAPPPDASHGYMLFRPVSAAAETAPTKLANQIVWKIKTESALWKQQKWQQIGVQFDKYGKAFVSRLLESTKSILSATLQEPVEDIAALIGALRKCRLDPVLPNSLQDWRFEVDVLKVFAKFSSSLPTDFDWSDAELNEMLRNASACLYLRNLADFFLKQGPVSNLNVLPFGLISLQNETATISNALKIGFEQIGDPRLRTVNKFEILPRPPSPSGLGVVWFWHRVRKSELLSLLCCGPAFLESSSELFGPGLYFSEDLSERLGDAPPNEREFMLLAFMDLAKVVMENLDPLLPEKVPRQLTSDNTVLVVKGRFSGQLTGVPTYTGLASLSRSQLYIVRNPKYVHFHSLYQFSTDKGGEATPPPPPPPQAKRTTKKNVGGENDEKKRKMGETKKAEEEKKRKLDEDKKEAELEKKKKIQGEDKKRMDQAKKAEEEKQRLAAAKEKKRKDQEAKKAEEEKKRMDREAKKAEEEKKRLVADEEEKKRKDREAKMAEEEKKRLAAAEEEKKRMDQEAKKAEEEEQRMDQEAKKAEEEKQRLAAAEEEKKRKDEEGAAKKAEEEKQRLAAAEEEKKRKDQEAKKAEEEKQRMDQEAKKAEEEKKRLASAEEKKRMDQETKKAEEEKQRLVAAEEEKKRTDQEAKEAEEEKQRMDQEAKKAEEEKQRLVAAEEEKKRMDQEAKMAEEEKQRLAAAEEEKKRKDEEGAAKKAEENLLRLADDAAKKALNDEKRKAEEEKQRLAEEEKKQKADKDKQSRAEEASKKAEEEKKRRGEEKRILEKRKAEEEEKKKINDASLSKKRAEVEDLMRRNARQKVEPAKVVGKPEIKEPDAKKLKQEADSKKSLERDSKKISEPDAKRPSDRDSKKPSEADSKKLSLEPESKKLKNSKDESVSASQGPTPPPSRLSTVTLAPKELQKKVPNLTKSVSDKSRFVSRAQEKLPPTLIPSAPPSNLPVPSASVTMPVTSVFGAPGGALLVQTNDGQRSVLGAPPLLPSQKQQQHQHQHQHQQQHQHQPRKAEVDVVEIAKSIMRIQQPEQKQVEEDAGGFESPKRESKFDVPEEEPDYGVLLEDDDAVPKTFVNASAVLTATSSLRRPRSPQTSPKTPNQIELWGVNLSSDDEEGKKSKKKKKKKKKKTSSATKKKESDE